MVKVESKSALRKLTNKFMKVNRSRNIITIIAIVLTSTLFMAVMTAASSMIESNRDSEIRQNMSSSHVIIQDLTSEEYSKVISAVKEYDKTAKYGTDIFLGLAMDPNIDFQTEVRLADENAAESFLCLPTEGRLPAVENEIACSTLVLDALGIKHEIGQNINLSIEVADKEYTNSFELVGFWQGDDVASSQEVYVSETYADSILYPVNKAELENGILYGSYGISVWFNNTWDIEGKTEQLNQKANLNTDTAMFKANPAFLIFEEDAFSFSSLFLLIAIFFLAGYLIVYNVFQISVNVDIRTYGLLKNIGITGKQLKKIVRMQATRLSIIGIPIGLLMGYLAGRAMVPSLVSDGIDSAENAVVTISLNPAIFVIAVVLTVITVFTACILPCRIVQRVSPIEALKVTESESSAKKKAKKNKINPFSMAFANIRRSWKKGLIVMVSIALSLVTLNSVIILVNGFDFKKYASTYITFDFEISQTTNNLGSSDLQCITPEIREVLDSCPDSEINGYIYCSKLQHKMDNVLYDNCLKLYNATNQDMYEELLKIWNESLENRTMKVHLMGINEGVFKKLSFKDESLSWDDFKKENYVITDYPDYDYDAKYYSSGDKVAVEYDTGYEKVYTILGEASIPYSLDYPFFDDLYITIMVPESDYLEHSENQNAMRATVDAQDGKEEEVNRYIGENIAGKYDEFRLDSILELREDFNTYLQKFYIIGGVLAAILALIGIMNFFNTSATSVISRKRELTLLEIVGMTKKQVKWMLISEGCIYLVGAFIIAIILILSVSEKILYSTLGIAWYFEFNMTIMPCIAIIPILILIAYIVPAYNYKHMCKESIVERVRE